MVAVARVTPPDELDGVLADLDAPWDAPRLTGAVPVAAPLDRAGRDAMLALAAQMGGYTDG